MWAAPNDSDVTQLPITKAAEIFLPPLPRVPLFVPIFGFFL